MQKGPHGAVDESKSPQRDCSGGGPWSELQLAALPSTAHFTPGVVPSNESPPRRSALRRTAATSQASSNGDRPQSIIPLHDALKDSRGTVCQGLD